jgi:sec-independent protein translocase protein TatA
MFNNLSGWHFLIILIVVLLLFGAPKLPALARSLGQSMRIFRGEVKNMKNDDTGENTAEGVANVSEKNTVASEPPLKS